MTPNDSPENLEKREPKGFRTCAQTRACLPRIEMIRFVADEKGNVFPDVSARAPGRGVWLKPEAAVLTAAIKSNAFSRALKRGINPSSNLIEQTINAQKAKVLGLLGLAKRSGNLISGFDKVEDELRKNAPAFLIEASDGSEDGRGKLIALSKKWGEVPIIGCFSSQDLGKTLGRDNMVHIIMPKGQFAQNWGLELKKLEGFVELAPQNWRN